jgi:nitric oxide reductase NorQ protein
MPFLSVQHGEKDLKMSESAIQEYRVATEPYYLPVGREIELFEAAHSARLPVILKGPTGWHGGSNVP